MKTGIYSLGIGRIYDWVTEIGLPRFRADQIIRRIYGGCESFSEMTELSLQLRERLEQDFLLSEAASENIVGDDDGTKKILFSMLDGEKVEGVLMSYKHGNTVCVSTQAGCRMGCAFCASPPEGFCRNLTPGEIMGQVFEAGKLCGGRVDNVVLMGIGEPLDNFDNVVTFLDNISHPDGYKMSLRHLSLSTCGLADRIVSLAQRRLGLTLSVSLHAPDDATRDVLMPVNRKFNVASLLEACDVYTKQTGRRICFEYTLIDGVNDSRSQAAMLAEIARSRLCHVNIIEYNRVKGGRFSASPPEKIKWFLDFLVSKGVSATRRRTLGYSLEASCGQLRRSGQNS